MECGGAGLLRDSRSIYIRSGPFLSQHDFWGVASALEAELRAILLGLTTVKQQQLHPIIIESDCLVAVNEANRPGVSFSPCGAVIREIQCLANTFSDCTLIMFLDVNCLAHDLGHLLALYMCNNSGGKPCPLFFCNPIRLYFTIIGLVI